jgi:hypothetical protein
MLRIAKEAGMPELIGDEILQKYRFCNIRRRHDRVTKWLLQYYYTNNIGDVWFKALIARIFNWPPTLDYLMKNDLIPHRVEEFEAERMIEFLQILEAGKFKIFNAAYVVYPTHKKGSKCENIVKYILEPTLELADEIRCGIEWDSIETTTKALSKGYGLSTFMAGQVTADLSYIMGELINAHDLYTWAPMGPGSVKGLNRLHNRPADKKLSEEQFLSELNSARKYLIKAEKDYHDLTLHDVQNIFCEFSKYMKVKDGLGTPKQIYKPTKEF